MPYPQRRAFLRKHGNMRLSGSAYTDHTRHRAQQSFYGTGDLTLSVGILNPEIEYAAALVCQSFIHDRLIHTAEMHESGRTRCKSGDLRTLRQIARREFCFHLFRCHGDLRKQKLC